MEQLQSKVMQLEHMLMQQHQHQHQLSNSSQFQRPSSGPAQLGMHDIAARYQDQNYYHANPNMVGYHGGNGAGSGSTSMSNYYQSGVAGAPNNGGSSHAFSRLPTQHTSPNYTSAAESQLYLRATELEAANAALQDRLRIGEERFAQLEAQCETLQRELHGERQQRIAAAKIAEATATSSAVETRKALEEADRAAAVWGTIQQLRAAFSNAELQSDLQRERNKLESGTSVTKASRNSFKPEPASEPLQNAKSLKSELKSERTSASKTAAAMSDFVSTYNSGFSRANANTGETGKKRVRGSSNDVDNEEANDRFKPRSGAERVIVPANVPIPRSALSLARRHVAENEMSSVIDGTPSGKTANRPTAKKAGRTPRTPKQTGAEKLTGITRQNLARAYGGIDTEYVNDEDEDQAVYDGPKGVRQMSSVAMSSLGGHGVGGGRTPPFSPMPKPTHKSAFTHPLPSSNAVTLSKFVVQNDNDVSATFDVNSSAVKGDRNYLSNSQSAANSQNNRSHTNMDFLRHGGAVGVASSNANALGTDNRYRNRNAGPITRSPTPTNPTRGLDIERRFILSGLTDDDRQRIHTAVARLGQKAEVLDLGVDAAPPKSCTHVVIPGQPESFKALCGLVSGRWLLTPQYIFDSYDAGYWLNEADANGVRCQPLPLKDQKFLVPAPQQATPDALSMKARLEFIVQYGEGFLVDSARGSGIVIIQSGDDILNYCLRPQN